MQLKTKTDRELSLISDEYIWDSVHITEAHGFIMPVFKDWLKNKQGARLLDIGCGNGVLTNFIADLDIECVGTDFSQSGIEIASVQFPKVSFIQSNIDDPIPAHLHQSFDIVLASEVIEHLFLPRKLFDRAKEALKPGGSLIITTPYHGYFKNLALAIADMYDYHWHPLRDYGHVKFFSLKTLKKLFEEQGFSIVKVRRVGRIPLFARSMIIEGKLK